MAPQQASAPAGGPSGQIPMPPPLLPGPLGPPELDIPGGPLGGVIPPEPGPLGGAPASATDAAPLPPLLPLAPLLPPTTGGDDEGPASPSLLGGVAIGVFVTPPPSNDADAAPSANEVPASSTNVMSGMAAQANAPEAKNAKSTMRAFGEESGSCISSEPIAGCSGRASPRRTRRPARNDGPLRRRNGSQSAFSTMRLATDGLQTGRAGEATDEGRLLQRRMKTPSVGGSAF